MVISASGDSKKLAILYISDGNFVVFFVEFILAIY